MLKARELFLTSVAALAAVVATRQATLPGPETYAKAISTVFQDVSRELKPSVVGVKAYRWGGRRRVAQGTGVIIGSDGTIVTNNHVVAGGETHRVTLYDGREFEAELVGRDPETDLAVLRIEAPGVQAAELQTNVEVGEWVLAMGNPYGLQQSVTAGIISAKRRQGLGVAQYENFLQTDAEIHPGNSGGPLVNLDGEVVGINTAILEEGAKPISFAIPSTIVAPIVVALEEHGRISRGWLGVEMEELTAETKRQFSLGGRGVAVRRVFDDSPAKRAGLMVGDVVLQVGDRPVATMFEMQMAITLAGAADTELEIWRDGRRLERTIRLAELPTR